MNISFEPNITPIVGIQTEVLDYSSELKAFHDLLEEKLEKILINNFIK